MKIYLGILLKINFHKINNQKKRNLNSFIFKINDKDKTESRKDNKKC